MSPTLTLTGLLPFVILLAAGLSFPLSFALLKLYRRSVQKGMSAVAGPPGGEPMPAVAGLHPPSAELQFVMVEGRALRRKGAIRGQFWYRAVYGPWRLAALYAIAGLAFALVMTVGWILATRDDAVVWPKLLILFWTYFWPTVLATLLVAVYDRKRRLQLVGAYFIVFLMLAAIAVARNPDLGIGSLPFYWVLINGPSTLLLASFLVRSIRAVGPLVLAFLIAVAIGSQVVVSAAAANEGLLRAIAEAGFSIGLNAVGVFSAMILLGILIFGLLGWPLLRVIGKRYENKKLSDQSIMLDAMWLLFGVVQSVGLAFEGAAWIMTGFVAFVAYKGVLRVSFQWWAINPDVSDARTLLLLRVFALGKRSERLFDKLRRHWQHVGSIFMIAGPDLVTTTVEPHEFLEFLSGRLSRQFVTDRSELENRTANLDLAVDPDGRYRINEFFCHADTWQMTVERLATTSDAVLMDLRSFSQANQGCIFELGRLVDGVDLNRVVFLVDADTERGFLESTMQRLWLGMSADSPNQTNRSPTVREFKIERQSESELRALMGLLLTPPEVANSTA